MNESCIGGAPLRFTEKETSSKVLRVRSRSEDVGLDGF
jgi:hypothetical protein